jgi:hypothetical protein
MSIVRRLVAASLTASTAAVTSGEPLKMSVVLVSAAPIQEDRPAGIGHGVVTFDPATRQVAWSIDYTGLSGPLQFAHFQGPVAPTALAGAVLLIPVTRSPLRGTAVVSRAMAAHLLADTSRSASRRRPSPAAGSAARSSAYCRRNPPAGGIPLLRRSTGDPDLGPGPRLVSARHARISSGGRSPTPPILRHDSGLGPPSRPGRNS